MKITLTNPVIKYLREKKKNTLTLYIRAAGGGWCGTVYIPDMNNKVPAALEDYHHDEIEGIDVYVSKDAAIGTADITFKLRGVWIFKRVTVNGIQYPKI